MMTLPPPDPQVPAAASNGRRKAAMSFIMVTVLLDMIAIGLIIPVLPHIVGTFTASKAEQAWWFGAVALAFLILAANRPIGGDVLEDEGLGLLIAAGVRASRESHSGEHRGELTRRDPIP